MALFAPKRKGLLRRGGGSSAAGDFRGRPGWRKNKQSTLTETSIDSFLLNLLVGCFSMRGFHICGLYLFVGNTLFSWFAFDKKCLTTHSGFHKCMCLFLGEPPFRWVLKTNQKETNHCGGAAILMQAPCNFCESPPGTATNELVPVLHSWNRRVSHVMPVTDNGGSTAEILRVLRGPAIGDIRSRLVNLSKFHLRRLPKANRPEYNFCRRAVFVPTANPT